jgi:hypothetical protein
MIWLLLLLFSIPNIFPLFARTQLAFSVAFLVKVAEHGTIFDFKIKEKETSYKIWQFSCLPFTYCNIRARHSFKEKKRETEKQRKIYEKM